MDKLADYFVAHANHGRQRTYAVVREVEDLEESEVPNLGWDKYDGIVIYPQLSQAGDIPHGGGDRFDKVDIQVDVLQLRKIKQAEFDGCEAIGGEIDRRESLDVPERVCDRVRVRIVKLFGKAGAAIPGKISCNQNALQNREGSLFTILHGLKAIKPYLVWS